VTTLPASPFPDPVDGAALAGVAGPAFPFAVDPATGRIAMTAGAAKVRENVRVVLGTRVGERPMLRTFGTRLAGLVQEPNDDLVVEIAAKQTVDALLQWEPRILVADSAVERDPDAGEVHLRITYLHTNERIVGTAIVPIG
jgi:uncharacterized protein